MSTARNFSRAASTVLRANGTIQSRLNGRGSGLRLIGEEVMTDVLASRAGAGVPRDTGALAGTGRVTGPFWGLVTLIFGSPSVQYAIRQHEDLSFHHPIGEAQYLVRGLERWKPGGSAAIAALAANVRAGMRAAGGGR